MSPRRFATTGLFLIAFGLALLIVDRLERRRAPAGGREIGTEAEAETDRERAKVRASEPRRAERVRTELERLRERLNAQHLESWAARRREDWSRLTAGATLPAAVPSAVRDLAADSLEAARLVARLGASQERDDDASRQLELAAMDAARAAATRPSLARALRQAEVALDSTLRATRYILALPGASPRRVTPAQLDSLLASATDLPTRESAWLSRLADGRHQSERLVKLRDLRNAIARAAGYPSHFALTAATYGLSSEQAVTLCEELLAAVAPLYEQLHGWIRHELARRYGVRSPDVIPAHWLADPWARTWPGAGAGASGEPTGATAGQPITETANDVSGDASPARFLLEPAERLRTAFGRAPLPAAFWQASDIAPLDGAGEAAHDRIAVPKFRVVPLDLRDDVRLWARLGPGTRSQNAAVAALAEVDVWLELGRSQLPPLLRRPASPALVDAAGDLAALATACLQERDPSAAATTGPPAPVARLLAEALTGPIVALPFLCGTLVHWEREFYADELPAARLGARWWQLARTYQGIAPPPAAGTTDWCPAACPPLATAPGHGYDAAFGAVLAHELHARICREILDQDPLTADYRSQPDPFAPLDAVVARGAELTWPQLVQAAAGGTLSAAALVDYYAPLLAWLEEQNRDRRTAFR